MVFKSSKKQRKHRLEGWLFTEQQALHAARLATRKLSICLTCNL